MITIGITDCGKKFIDYERWVRSADPSVEILKLSAGLKNSSLVPACSGVLLSGGKDVHPRAYGKAGEDGFREVANTDEARDELELEVVRRALDARIPLMGICRGLQVVNVFFGGTLFADLEKAGRANH